MAKTQKNKSRVVGQTGTFGRRVAEQRNVNEKCESAVLFCLNTKTFRGISHYMCDCTKNSEDKSREILKEFRSLQKNPALKAVSNSAEDTTAFATSKSMYSVHKV